MQTKKLASLGLPGKSLMHKGKDTRRGWTTARQDRMRPREPLRGKPRTASPLGSQDCLARSAPGPTFQWNQRGWGREGTEARVQSAATQLRLSLPGVFSLGEVHPHAGTRQAGFLRRVGRAVQGPGGREGRAGRVQPPAPESTFDASPTPHDKMATWTAGEPGQRGWGS